MSRPRIAVVIPTYQRRALLAATLDAVSALDPGPDELVVVSDGSTDGTKEMVAARGLRLLTTARSGAAAARNAGWRATSAEVIAFTDDDCVPEPGWLGALVSAFDDDRVGLVQGATLPAGAATPLDRTVRVVAETGLYETCNIAYRRAALVQVGGFDERFARRIGLRGRPFGEDTDLAWRTRRAGWAARFASNAVVRHHVFPGTVRSTFVEEWRRGRFPAVVKEIPELRDLAPGGRWFLRRQSAPAQAALIGAALAAVTRSLLPLTLALPYARWLSTRTRDPRRAAHLAALDMTSSVALVLGSARSRCVLL